MIKIQNAVLSKKEQSQKDQLKKSLPYPEVFIDILFHRGYRTEEEIDQFFHANLNQLNDTSLLKDADRFVDLLHTAIQENWLIVNYSDYDCDGATSAATTLLAIQNLGGTVVSYINNRFTGGYGINRNGIDEILEKYPECKLILTTDNGISAIDAVAYAKSKGLSVIVTDHHEPKLDEHGKQILPPADAVIDPKRQDDSYPFSGLCGCGLIWKLLLYYYWQTGQDVSYMYSLLDIVALGTQCDVVPLRDENRIIVREGLKLMRNGSRECFEKLRIAMDVTKIDDGTLGFKFGPAINALGRVTGSADLAVKFLTSTDDVSSETLSHILVEENTERKKLTEEQTELAINELEGKPLPNIIISYHEDYHEGIAGIIAGRLKERYHRPAIVISRTGYEDPEYGYLCKASARSISSIHMFECLCKLKDYLIEFGGHAMAAGFSLYENQIESFTKAFNELLDGSDFDTVITIDSVLDAKSLDVEQIESLEMLQPFGAEFPSPVFGLQNFEVDLKETRNKYIKNDGVRLKNKEGLTVLMFQEGAHYRKLGEPTHVKAIGTPSVNLWQGKAYPQFLVMNNYLSEDK